MAFQCEDCWKKEHPKQDINENRWPILHKSYGPCEDCGKMKVCADL